MYTVFGIFVLIVLVLVAFHIVQKKFPNKLPEKLQTWEFLPSTVYDVLCLTVPEETPDSEDIEKNVNMKEMTIEEKQPKKMLVGSASRVSPLTKENTYVSIKSFNMNQVNEIDETNNDDLNEPMHF